MAIISLRYAYTVFWYTRVANRNQMMSWFNYLKAYNEIRSITFYDLINHIREFDHVICCVRYHLANTATSIKGVLRSGCGKSTNNDHSYQATHRKYTLCTLLRCPLQLHRCALDEV